ncbi:hypothetical protein CSUI_004670 [Cystoisospora suis]|uniref:Uncharacterized protein n=1 Tax=Cystoisospora suis TaxID=483139 RepID=A0A2C6KXW9_9APIC|nr:hypothetical protein CSUI_004670 [Cystoisospora suis]
MMECSTGHPLRLGSSSSPLFWSLEPAPPVGESERVPASFLRGVSFSGTLGEETSSHVTVEDVETACQQAVMRRAASTPSVSSVCGAEKGGSSRLLRSARASFEGQSSRATATLSASARSGPTHFDLTDKDSVQQSPESSSTEGETDISDPSCGNPPRVCPSSTRSPSCYMEDTVAPYDPYLSEKQASFSSGLSIVADVLSSTRESGHGASPGGGVWPWCAGGDVSQQHVTAKDLRSLAAVLRIHVSGLTRTAESTQPRDVFFSSEGSGVQRVTPLQAGWCLDDPSLRHPICDLEAAVELLDILAQALEATATTLTKMQEKVAYLQKRAETLSEKLDKAVADNDAQYAESEQLELRLREAIKQVNQLRKRCALFDKMPDYRARCMASEQARATLELQVKALQQQVDELRRACAGPSRQQRNKVVGRVLGVSRCRDEEAEEAQDEVSDSVAKPEPACTGGHQSAEYSDSPASTPVLPGARPVATGEVTLESPVPHAPPAGANRASRCVACGCTAVPLFKIDRLEAQPKLRRKTSKEPEMSLPVVEGGKETDGSRKLFDSVRDRSHSFGPTAAARDRSGTTLAGEQTSLVSPVSLASSSGRSSSAHPRRQSVGGHTGRTGGKVEERLPDQPLNEVVSPASEVLGRGKTYAEPCGSSKPPACRRGSCDGPLLQETSGLQREGEIDCQAELKPIRGPSPPHSLSSGAGLTANGKESGEDWTGAVKTLHVEESGDVVCSACLEHVQKLSVSDLDERGPKPRYCRTGVPLRSLQGTRSYAPPIPEPREVQGFRSLGSAASSSLQLAGRTSGISLHRSETAWRRLARRGTLGDSTSFSRRSTCKGIAGSPLFPVDGPAPTSILYSTGSLSTLDQHAPSMFEELLRSGTLLTAEEANMKANLEKLLVMVATSPVSFGDLTKTGLSQDCLLKISKLRRQRKGADASTTGCQTGQRGSPFWRQTARLCAFFRYITGGAGREASSSTSTTPEVDGDIRSIYASAVHFAAELLRMISCGRVCCSSQGLGGEDTSLGRSTTCAEEVERSGAALLSELTRPGADTQGTPAAPCAAPPASDTSGWRGEWWRRRDDGRCSRARRQGCTPEDGYASVPLVLVAVVAAIGTAIFVGRFCSGSNSLTASQRETDGWIAGPMGGLKAALHCPSGHAPATLLKKGYLCG